MDTSPKGFPGTFVRMINECRFSKGDVVKLLRPGRHQGRLGWVSWLHTDCETLQIRLLRRKDMIRRWNEYSDAGTHIFCSPISVHYSELELICRRVRCRWIGRQLVKFPCPKGENPKVSIVHELQSDCVKVRHTDGGDTHVSKLMLYTPPDDLVFREGDEVLCPVLTSSNGGLLVGWRRGEVLDATLEGMIQVRHEKIDVTPDLIMANSGWKSYDTPSSFYLAGDLRQVCENKIGSFMSHDVIVPDVIEPFEPLLI